MINKYVLNPILKKLKADSLYNKMLDNINMNTNFIRNGESILAVNLDNVRKKIDIWNKNMIDIRPHFAVKSFPDPKICNEFTYFDCASAGEIKMIQQINKNETQSDSPRIFSMLQRRGNNTSFNKTLFNLLRKNNNCR